jgi:hypothetical protein
LPRLGLGALLVALRKVHGRRDEESGYASPLIVIEARIIAKAHATLWTKYARRVGARLGAVKTYAVRCMVRGGGQTCLATQEAFPSGLWCENRQSRRGSGQALRARLCPPGESFRKSRVISTCSLASAGRAPHSDGLRQQMLVPARSRAGTNVGAEVMLWVRVFGVLVGVR